MKALRWMLGWRREANHKHIDESGSLGFRMEYDEGLIARLEADHTRLLSLLAGLKAVVDTNRSAQVAMFLRELKLELQGHLLVENVRLYTYLEQMAEAGVGGEIVRQSPEIKRTVSCCVYGVNSFVDRYLHTKIEGATVELFNMEVDVVSELLARRFQLEESVLYPAYRRYVGGS